MFNQEQGPIAYEDWDAMNAKNTNLLNEFLEQVRGVVIKTATRGPVLC